MQCSMEGEAEGSLLPLFYGLQPVEYVGVFRVPKNGDMRNKKPPAMRVRVKKLYKITFPIYNRGVQAAIKERKGDLYGEESQ